MSTATVTTILITAANIIVALLQGNIVLAICDLIAGLLVGALFSRVAGAATNRK